MTELTVETTDIPGLLVVRLPLHEDARGWFKENWQRAKMTALGLPDFGPVQHSVAYNARRGVTRGVHTEPWDKFISVAHGRIFGAWVDMRQGETFGTTVTLEMDTSVAVFVPRGVGNSYQTLEDATAYTYLVNEHWRPGVAYPALALDDPSVAIDWPIPLSEAIISEKDRHNPALDPATADGAALGEVAAFDDAADLRPDLRDQHRRGAALQFGGQGDGLGLGDDDADTGWPLALALSIGRAVATSGEGQGRERQRDSARLDR